MATYRFLMSGQGPRFAKPYTKEGKQYYGFQTNDDGRIGFLRKGFKNLDDEDAGVESSFVDYLDKNTKFYAKNPSEGDFIGSNYKTVQNFIDTKDAPYDAEGNLVRYHGGQQRLYPAVYYENLQKWAANQNKPATPDPTKPADTTAPAKSPPPADGKARYKIDQRFYNSKEYKSYDPSAPSAAVVTYSPYFGTSGNSSSSQLGSLYQQYAKRTGFDPDKDFLNVNTSTTDTGTNMATTITTDTELEQRMGDLAGGLSTGTPQLTVVRPTVKNDEIQTTTGAKVAGTVAAGTNYAVNKAGPATPTATEGVGERGATATTVNPDGTLKADDMGTTQITPAGDYVDMQGVEGKVSSSSLASAQTEELDERGTVKYQMTSLLSALEEGGEMPAWASPAVRKVGAIMQARGLGASSMASAAMTQAVMESGIAIATQDANKYSTIQLQNLNNKQQTALQNALTYAGMDKANLSARLQGAVTNAQSLLSVDTANLTAEQQTNTINYNALVQGLFKDTAEENARSEFNAKNESQVQEFFAELGSQVETANANRVAANSQFNAGEANAQGQFNASMRDARDKFNGSMQFAIDQSNTQWRRQVNTADTALQNETNRINVQNNYNMSQSALNALWQKYRDNASWNFSKSESAIQRQHEVGIMAMEFANSKETYTQQQKDNIGIGVGNWLATWAANA